jgi:hypothetical protein
VFWRLVKMLANLIQIRYVDDVSKADTIPTVSYFLAKEEKLRKYLSFLKFQNPVLLLISEDIRCPWLALHSEQMGMKAEVITRTCSSQNLMLEELLIGSLMKMKVQSNRVYQLANLAQLVT